MSSSAKFSVLVTDPIDAEGLEIIKNHPSFELKVLPAGASRDLGKDLNGFDAWLVRSETRVTRELLERASRLKLAGRVGAAG